MRQTWEKSLEMTSGIFQNILKAVIHVYPMIVLANLSKNKYYMIQDEGFLYNEVLSSGCYDDLIDAGVDNIHANYQSLFLNCFSRENLIRNFEKGQTDVYAELYQKDTEGKFHWVSTHAIRIEDESGDIMHICLNRVLDNIVENRYSDRK
ncbi:MAG: hypothetical protein Q4D32_05800 [Eubacteriales bacterium]|nr:hypothetical protein [Eubacteriales bacterium]